MIQLSINARSGKTHVAYLRRQIRAAFQRLRTSVRELSVALVNDREMSDVHQRFLKIAGPTDVITFELEHNRRGKATAGEVVVCVDEAKRQSRARKTEVREELLLYAIHGLLHLSGFDDRTAASHAAMHRKEDEILKRIGVGPVYARKQKQKRRGR